MELHSKIKEIFPEEVIKLLGSICDCNRIPSAQKKMRLIQQLLKRFDIRFTVLGGATNRVTLMINGYAIKFAIDRQGYKDNLIEYAISRELQPYVTKAYETNGYMVVHECVKTMTIDDFRLRKFDILKVLETISQDYLLGDVGYIKKNFTNWGVRDDGSVVILDYAYCHRATENLFTCNVCGSGFLNYDSSFSYLKCNNATVCTAKYDYLDRKEIQGDEVDWEMIQEAFDNSVKVNNGIKTVEVFDNDGLLQKHKLIINTREKYEEYLRRKSRMGNNYNRDEAITILIKLINASPEEKVILNKRLSELYEEANDFDDEYDDDDIEITYPDILRQEEEEEEELVNASTPKSHADMALSITEMIEIAKQKKQEMQQQQINPYEYDYTDDYAVGVEIGGCHTIDFEIPSNILTIYDDDDYDYDDGTIIGKSYSQRNQRNNRNRNNNNNRGYVNYNTESLDDESDYIDTTDDYTEEPVKETKPDNIKPYNIADPGEVNIAYAIVDTINEFTSSNIPDEPDEEIKEEFDAIPDEDIEEEVDELPDDTISEVPPIDNHDSGTPPDNEVNVTNAVDIGHTIANDIRIEEPKEDLDESPPNETVKVDTGGEINIDDLIASMMGDSTDSDTTNDLDEKNEDKPPDDKYVVGVTSDGEVIKTSAPITKNVVIPDTKILVNGVEVN